MMIIDADLQSLSGWYRWCGRGRGRFGLAMQGRGVQGAPLRRILAMRIEIYHILHDPES